MKYLLPIISILLHSCTTRNIDMFGCIYGDCNNGYGAKRLQRLDSELTRFEMSTALGSNVYIGDWREGKRHGHGTLTGWPPFRYVGQWANDMMNGHATLKFEAAVFIGIFKQNQAEGSGSLDIPGLGKYEGSWLDSYPVGSAIYTDSKGRKCQIRVTLNRRLDPYSILPSRNYAISTIQFESGKSVEFRYEPNPSTNLLQRYQELFRILTCD